MDLKLKFLQIFCTDGAELLTLDSRLICRPLGPRLSGHKIVTTFRQIN